jgi:hypothetical protein
MANLCCPISGLSGVTVGMLGRVGMTRQGMFYTMVINTVYPAVVAAG